MKKADNRDDKESSYVPTLFRIPDRLGAKPARVAKAKMMSSGPSKTKVPKIKRSALRANEAYLLDSGFHLYVWLGSKATGGARQFAVHHAETYFNSYKRAVMPVSIIKQGQKEGAGFSALIVDDGQGGCVCTVM